MIRHPARSRLADTVADTSAPVLATTTVAPAGPAVTANARAEPSESPRAKARAASRAASMHRTSSMPSRIAESPSASTTTTTGTATASSAVTIPRSRGPDTAVGGHQRRRDDRKPLSADPSQNRGDDRPPTSTGRAERPRDDAGQRRHHRARLHDREQHGGE